MRWNNNKNYDIRLFCAPLIHLYNHCDAGFPLEVVVFGIFSQQNYDIPKSARPQTRHAPQTRQTRQTPQTRHAPQAQWNTKKTAPRGTPFLVYTYTIVSFWLTPFEGLA